MIKKLVVIAILFAFFVSTASFADEKLQGDELKQLHMDKTFDMTNKKKGHGFVYFGPDGYMKLVLDNGVGWEGKWWINDEGNKRCFQKDGGKKPSCVFVERRNNGEYALVKPKNNKTTVIIHKILEGNQIPE